MAKTVEKKKLVVIDGNGSIPELGGISAPIINPTWIGIPTLIRIVNRYKKIYEVNPNNKSERIQLTIRNVRKDNFPEPPGPAPVVDEEVKETLKKKGKKGKNTETSVPFVVETDANGNNVVGETLESKAEKSEDEKNDVPVTFSSDFTKI